MKPSESKRDPPMGIPMGRRSPPSIFFPRNEQFQNAARWAQSRDRGPPFENVNFEGNDGRRRPPYSWLPMGMPMGESHLASLGLTWIHLDSLGLTWTHLHSLELTWSHLDSLGFTWIRLDPFGFTWTHLASLGLIWTHLDSLGLTWTYLNSLGLT